MYYRIKKGINSRVKTKTGLVMYEGLGFWPFPGFWTGNFGGLATSNPLRSQPIPPLIRRFKSDVPSSFHCCFFNQVISHLILIFIFFLFDSCQLCFNLYCYCWPPSHFSSQSCDVQEAGAQLITVFMDLVLLFDI